MFRSIKIWESNEVSYYSNIEINEMVTTIISLTIWEVNVLKEREKERNRKGRFIDLYP